MTIDTQEARRLLDDAYFDGSRRAYDNLRALLSAKEGEPSEDNWRVAVEYWYDSCIGDEEWSEIAQRAIALRDAEKEKGNG